MNIVKRRNILLICFLVHILMVTFLFFPFFSKDGNYYNIFSALTTSLYKNTAYLIIFIYSMIIFISSLMTIFVGFMRIDSKIFYINFIFLGLAFISLIVLIIMTKIYL